MLPDFRLHQRDYLTKITQAMSSKLNLPDLLKLILESAVRLLAGHAGLIVLRNENGKLSAAASIGLPRDVVPYFKSLWENIPADHTKDIPDIRLRLALASRATGVLLRQVVALPLQFEEDNKGYIFIFRGKGEASFTISDNQILATFANQAAIAVHNAYLYQQVIRQRENLNAIIENSGDGIMIINPFRIISTWNKTLANLTGISTEDAIGKPCYDVLNLKTKNGMSVCHTRCPILNSSEYENMYIEGFHKRLDGLKISFADKYSPRLNNEGEMYEYIANVRDVSHLRENEDLKETLLAVISHELKTPVSIIKGYAGTLAREDADWGKDVIRDGLIVIEEEADKLNTLITNLLQASRLQSGHLKLKHTQIDLSVMVKKSVESLRATTAKHQFEVEFPHDFPYILADYARMWEVITNLINNAIKYSPNGGMIKLGGEVLDNTVRLFVTDEGIGIPPSAHSIIFERFHRIDNSLTRKAKGTGLGLFLVKSVVEAHGGTVWVESQPGMGSTFWVELPMEKIVRG
ncbi:MAG: hypothetical protein B6242_09940 [Anaerolineaceae bacterium 4572_78]|nr:MAG: hypothetical protein B6242_09940 [Anaerolineaceae bacterium 4572_78]